MPSRASPDDPTFKQTHSQRARDATSLRLRVLSDDFAASHELPSIGDVVIGRGADADVRIDGSTISRKHAVLHVGATIEIEDVGSANGTFVRGDRLSPNVRARIDVGDVVELGSIGVVVLGKRRASTREEKRRLHVERDGRWFRLPGRREVYLYRRKTLCAILRLLARSRIERPGVPVTVAELFSAGWSEPAADARAAANRVYVALNTLRSMGLRDVLLARGRDGYLLDPSLDVELVDQE